MMNAMKQYLEPTPYIDFNHNSVMDFAIRETGNLKTPIEKAIKLYYSVRDGLRYNPYVMTLDKSNYSASFVLSQGEGFCIQKAIVLAAGARALGIPARLGFADVVNHLTTRRLRDILKTDLIVFHGYTQLYLEGAWVKATTAFDRNLCDRFGIRTLEFDGREDSVFHPFDREGRTHMEYVNDRGTFADFPFDLMVSEMRKAYPHLVHYFDEAGPAVNGDFHREASEEKDRSAR